MSEFKEIISEYIKNGDIGDMTRLAHVLGCLMEEIESKHPDLYKKYMTKAKLANSHIEWDKEQAEYAVAHMKNKDGTTGEHWSFSKTTDELERRHWEFNPAEWYYVLNMIYSDHGSSGVSTEMCMEFAKDIITDVDAPACSTKRVYIAKHFKHI